MNKLEQLRQYTTVVADTGDIETIQQFKPEDATTNPSLILAAATKPQYKPLIIDALQFARQEKSEDKLGLAIRKLMVNFGQEILKIIPGAFLPKSTLDFLSTPRKVLMKRKELLNCTNRWASIKNVFLSKWLQPGKA